VPSQAGRVAKDGPDIGVVDNVLKTTNRRIARTSRPMPLLAVQRSEGTAMDMESGYCSASSSVTTKTGTPAIAAAHRCRPRSQRSGSRNDRGPVSGLDRAG
jgi:hypothetical protein